MCSADQADPTVRQVNAYGVFESYYDTSRLERENNSVVALIGALQLFLLYGLGPFFGKIFDSYGVVVRAAGPHPFSLPRQVLLPVGSFCIVFAQMMLSIAQPDQAYQYFLSQGLLFGIGSAMVFTPALAVIGHYFRRNRGIAFGFVASGSSIGGVIFPIIYQRLFPRVGFGWSVRTSAFVCLACLIVSCALLRTRLPLKPTTTREILQFVDLGGFRDARYCCAAASAFLCV